MRTLANLSLILCSLAALWTGVAVVGFTTGCGPATGAPLPGPVLPPSPPMQLFQTPAGHQVWMSSGWNTQPVDRDAILAEVDATTGTYPHAGVAPGLPPGYVLVIPNGERGFWTTNGSWVGFATGQVDLNAKVLWVAVRCKATGPWLPALQHELDHAWCWELTGHQLVCTVYGHGTP